MKSLFIALKDTEITFRDRTALLMLIGAPLLVALVMGLAFGGSADISPISEIPVVVVNRDEGELGGEFADIIAGIDVDTAEGVKPLFAVTEMDDLEAAKTEIENGSARGVVYFPAAFSADLAAEPAATTVQVFTDPTATVSPAIVRGVVGRIATGFSTVVIGNRVAVDQVMETAETNSAVYANLGSLDEILADANADFGETEAGRQRITVASRSIGEGEGFDLLNYFVPSMAIFFLMFAVFGGTRSILEEERDGTLHRLMTTPTGTAEILLGKIGGSFLTGALQFAVLVLISGLVFGVDWGKAPLGVTLMALGTVLAATSLGAFVAAFARSVSQAAVVGLAISLISAILGGNFIDYRAIPAWLTPISRLTINRWALEGFFDLTYLGRSLQDVSLNILVLFGMAVVFFSLSVVLFRKRFVA